MACGIPVDYVHDGKPSLFNLLYMYIHHVWFPNTKWAGLYLCASTSMAFWEQTIFTLIVVLLSHCY